MKKQIRINLIRIFHSFVIMIFLFQTAGVSNISRTVAADEIPADDKIGSEEQSHNDPPSAAAEPKNSDSVKEENDLIPDENPAPEKNAIISKCLRMKFFIVRVLT